MGMICQDLGLSGLKPPFFRLFVSRRMTCYGRRTTCSAREDKICPPLLHKSSDKAEMMLWLSVSVSGIRYSKGRKFRPKTCQNAFGGRAPSEPPGGA